VPDLAALPADVWHRRSDLAGLEFDGASSLRFVRDELAEFIAEFAPPHDPTGDPAEYYLGNDLYAGLDADTLYAMVRRFRPRRIVELGSGMSSLVIARARERNGDLDDSVHEVYDPFAREDLMPALARLCRLHRISATDVPLEAFEQLGAGDILFVDTTHTVKLGGDVNRVVLEILPRLARGVLVHFHDIYLPYEYPREFFTELGFSWAEQYLVQAFLAFNGAYEVLFGTALLARDHRPEVARFAPNVAHAVRPSAFWIRRRSATHPDDRHG
jgi:predicted O-methyltransferase YrrM